MSIVDDLKHSINKILRESRSNSFATQADRRHMLCQFANDLVGLKYGLRDIKNLKTKHIIAVVQHWQMKNLSISTIKNRVAAIRFICKKMNKANVVPANDQMNIGRRSYKPTYNRAIVNPNFSKITNPYIYISLQLQRVFGLRREESLKIKPHLADKGEVLELLPTWCKGGRGRFVPIRTDEQRYWLDQAKQLAGNVKNSLIPSGKKYIQHRQVYDKQAQA